MRKTRFFYVNVILLVVLLNKMCVYGSTAAGEMKEHRSEPEIRVVLTDSDFQSVYHDSVTISLDEEETVYEAKMAEEKLFQSRSRKTALAFHRSTDSTVCLYTVGEWRSDRVKRDFC